MKKKNTRIIESYQENALVQKKAVVQQENALVQ